MKTVILFFLLCSSALAYSVAWTANPAPQGVTSYKVYRVKQHGADLVGTVMSPTLTFTVDSYLTGSRTKFYITAVNQNGESAKSGTVTIQRH